MSELAHRLSWVLQVVAFCQIGIAILNIFLVRILRWQEELARADLLLREVFHIHAWFISISLAIFGVMTWRFAGEMASGADPVLRWLAGAIGIFWTTRAVLQVTYYSRSHWRGNARRTLIHFLLLITYSGFAVAYFLSALRLLGR